MPSALEMRSVSAGYGETVVIEGIDLALTPGECISVIGRNGVGKSTLLSTVMGHTTLHAGEIMLDGKRAQRHAELSPRACRHRLCAAGTRDLSFVIGARESRCRRAAGAMDGRRVFALFPRLKERLDNMGNQLSGGEQQMLSIARALLTNPPCC